tara:strand:- start:1297 stop:3666 length:2370 start_codon:yes stop_codon:yes gene_type:complete
MAPSPQLTPQQLQKLADLYVRIDNLSAASAQSAAQQANSIGNAFNELTRLEASYRDLMADVSSTREAFANIVSDISKMDSGTKRATNAFRGLESLASKLQSHQAGIYTLSTKELEALSKKLQNKKADLELAKKLSNEQARTLYATRNNSTAQQEAYQKAQAAAFEIGEQIRENDSAYNTFNDQIQDSIEKQKGSEKSLKLTKSIVEGMSKIPIFGNILDTEAGLKAAEVAAGEGAGALGQMGASAEVMGQSLKEALGPVGLLLIVIEQIQEAIKLADGGAGDLAKDFNITYDAANRVRGQLASIAEESGDINVTTKGLQESMVAVGKTLGSNAALNKKDLVFMTQMREMAGFTNEEMAEMEKYTLATGGNLEDNTKNLMYGAKMASLSNNVMLNEKDIMKDVAKSGAAVKISIQGGAEALGRAAAQAKAVGLSLDKVNNIAGGLLDFESSINAELEAQLLTGKNINLEQARLYAINNDMEGLSREIAKNVGTSAEFSKMNRLQQDAISKAVGMDRDEVAQMLVDKEALQGLSGKEAEDAKKALDFARARGMTEEQIKGKTIEDLKHQQSVQERLEKSQEKMKEMFIQIAEPILDILSPLMDIVGEILPPILGLLQPIVGAFKAIGHAIAAIVKLLHGDFTGALKSIGEVPGDLVGGIKKSTQFKIANAISGGALGSAMGGIETPEANIQAAGDLYSPAGGKTRISTKEGGLFELSDNDNVMAFPTKGSNNQSSNNINIMAEIQEIKNILKQTLLIDMEIARKSSGTFGESALFTDKRGTTSNVNTYSVQ